MTGVQSTGIPTRHFNERVIKKTSQKTGKSIPARYVLALLCFWGLINNFAMRVNLSVTIVAMVKESQVNDTSGEKGEDACWELVDVLPHNHTTVHNASRSFIGEFDWDSRIQGHVLGSFFYGYIVTQIPGGVIAEKYGAKWLYGIGMLVTSILTLLTPIAARWSVWALFVARVIEGLGEGVALPATNTLIGRWAPKMERSRMGAFIFSGIPIGTVLSLAFSGILCDSDFFGGWPSVFYVCGAFGCIWCIVWIWLVYESPETHPGILKKELSYICDGQDRGQVTKCAIPWKKIWTSVPVWALIITHMGQAWGYYTLLIQLPMYLSSILHFDLKQNGLLSALPNLMLSIFAILGSIVADKLRKSGRLKITSIRKIFNSIGFYGPAICLFIVAFSGCRPVLIVILLSLSMGLVGCTNSGFLVTHVDMSPELAGTLYGITNCIANFCGFLVPAYVGWIMQDGQTVQRWGIIFITSSVVLTVCGTVYNIFSSAELQSWGKISHTSQDVAEPNAVEMAQNAK